jgi:type VI protein secretion system component Hcp
LPSRQIAITKASETELDQVAGGKPSATPKQEAFPTETIKFSYGAMQWQYTS